MARLLIHSGSNSQFRLRISVVLATYNGQPYLVDQLASISQQSLTPFEVVASDDNSTDETNHILGQFKDSVSFPVHIITNPNQRGVQSNFANALRHTTGDIVVWCDQDDLWEPNKLEELAKPFEDEEVLCAAHSYQTIDSEGSSMGIGRWFHGDRTLTGLEYANLHSFHGCCMAFRAEPVRDLLLQNWPTFKSEEGAKIPLLHDFATLFIARHLGKVRYIDKPLIQYRRHSGNYSAHKATDPEDAKLMRSITTSGSYQYKAAEAQFKAEWWKGTLEKWPELRAAYAIEDYERYANCLERRAHLYSLPKSKRMGKLLQNLTAGAYGRSTRGRLPLRSLLGDVMFSLRRDPA